MKQAGTITSNTNNHNEIKTVKRKESKNIRMKGTVYAVPASNKGKYREQSNYTD